jgi:hypothetical protein
MASSVGQWAIPQMKTCRQTLLPSHNVMFCGAVFVVWCGVVWCGVVHRVVWCGVVRCGMRTEDKLEGSELPRRWISRFLRRFRAYRGGAAAACCTRHGCPKPIAAGAGAMMIAVAAIQRWLGSRTLTQPFHDISHHSSLAAAAAAPITAITAITGSPIMRALSLSMWH